MDARPILGLQYLRPPFLDDVSATQAGCRTRSRRCSGRPGRRTGAGSRIRVVSHEMSLDYALEYPVDDPDEDDEDDVDEDDEDEDDEDSDEEDVETWQVFNPGLFR